MRIVIVTPWTRYISFE